LLKFSGGKELQFKNAVLTLASEAAFLVPDDPRKAITIFKEILKEIARVKYDAPVKSRICSLSLDGRGSKFDFQVT
jgi:hypothetical protein